MKNLARILFSCLLLLWAQLGVSETTETTYYIPDASGSPVAAMDEAGNIKWRKHYKPFGEEIEQDEASNLYDSKTNTFGVKDANGAPRTMFRPKDGMDYWNKQ
jgi:hypothetical protein